MSILKRLPDESLRDYLGRLGNAAVTPLFFFFVPLILINLLLTFNEPRISFSGRVVDQDGEPVANAALRWKVESKRLVFPDRSGEVRSGAEGEFWIRRKHMKGHTLIIESITAPGYKDATPPGEKIFRFNKDKATETPAGRDRGHEFTLEKL